MGVMLARFGAGSFRLPVQNRTVNCRSPGERQPEEEGNKMKRRLWALVAVIALLIAACGGDEGTGDTTDTTAGGATTTEAVEATTTSAAGEASTTAAAGGDGDCVVGMSWNNYNEERWALWDEPAIQAALEAGGCEYISADAGSSEEQQITDVENLISQGANVVIILAQNVEAVRPAVTAALEQKTEDAKADLISSFGLAKARGKRSEIGRSSRGRRRFREGIRGAIDVIQLEKVDIAQR